MGTVTGGELIPAVSPVKITKNSMNNNGDEIQEENSLWFFHFQVCNTQIARLYLGDATAAAASNT